MNYKILVDSCGEFTPSMQGSEIFESIPLYLMIGDYQMVDDASFDQSEYFRRAGEYKGSPRSACPSPEQYLAAYEGAAERVYVVTLSANLSGSYNSAMLAARLYEEKHPDKQIQVFDSCSASVGETLIALKIQECEAAGKSFTEVVAAVKQYITGQNTYFVLEDLDTLRKNGRLSGLKLLVASALKIKPILGATPEGTITQLGNARGMKKALPALAAAVIRDNPRDSREKLLAIAHCNNPERAARVRELILAELKVKDVIVVNTGGISTMYASRGGVIVVL